MPSSRPFGHVLPPPRQVLVATYTTGQGDTLASVCAACRQPAFAADELVAANLPLARRRGLRPAVRNGLGASFALEPGDRLRLPASWRQRPPRPDPRASQESGEGCKPCKAAKRAYDALRLGDDVSDAIALIGPDSALQDNTLDPVTLTIIQYAFRRVDGWVTAFPSNPELHRTPLPAALVPGFLNAAVQWWLAEHPTDPEPQDLESIVAYANAAAAFMQGPGKNVMHAEGIPWGRIPATFDPWIPLLQSRRVQWSAVRDWLAKQPASAIEGDPPVGIANYHTNETIWSSPELNGASFWTAIPWTEVPFHLIPWSQMNAQPFTDTVDTGGSSSLTKPFLQALAQAMGVPYYLPTDDTTGTGGGQGAGTSSDPVPPAALSYEAVRVQALPQAKANGVTLIGALVQELPQSRDLTTFRIDDVKTTSELVTRAKLAGAGKDAPTQPSTVVWVVYVANAQGEPAEPLATGTLQLAPIAEPGLSTEAKIGIASLVLATIGTVIAVWPTKGSS